MQIFDLRTQIPDDTLRQFAAPGVAQIARQDLTVAAHRQELARAMRLPPSTPLSALAEHLAAHAIEARKLVDEGEF